MKRFLFILKRVVQLLLIIAVIVGFVFTVGAAVNKNKTFVCSAIQVNVEYPPFMQLVNEKDIEDKIKKAVNTFKEGLDYLIKD